MSEGVTDLTTKVHQPDSQLLDRSDIVRILRDEVERAGGQSSWARKQGIDRTLLGRVLRDQKSPSKEIIRALRLCNAVEINDDPRIKIRSGSRQHDGRANDKG
jgi:DNA-binding phage protein